MRASFFPSFSFLLFILICGCNKQQTIDSYIKSKYEEGEFNGNILVLKNDSIIYSNSLGVVDQNQTPLTQNHFFGIGSIYKEFPAVAIMQLEENGILSLKDPISNFLDDLPSWSSQVTITHLLQYSSGLPKVDWESHFKNNSANLHAILNHIKTIENLSFTPGTDYLYSNYNPFLLIRIIEKVSNKSFNEYVEQNILKPHKIEGIVIKSIYPYKDNRLMALPVNSNLQPDEIKYELPTFCSTTTGMYHWFKLLDNYEIVSKESVKKLSEEVIEGDNIQAPLGRCDWENGDIALHLHHGSTGNYEVLVRNHKKEDIMIILLTNQKHENLNDIADRIIELTNN
ncbi:serine hydrolase domain-containing protein [Mangrovivirga cuniculi]|uniref:Beta-lactamase-related domain-containing protein n=1 Tax=Mangrovivirga cuniculi TaxID=2715131 RepID=A0A4D7K769_9BACT|nr:serine hydrolase domain-containing protein [Mangrovivirga cuniculi]QCK16554.1 hypothetical protein DCC35_18380 [Mangrovivirga cuniculi]